MIDRKKNKGSYIPITVRQLEAIIRISEAMAKMTLAHEVTERHVKEAHDLFTSSTLNFAAFDTGKEKNDKEIGGIINKIED